jgi:hypothetical protein
MKKCCKNCEFITGNHCTKYDYDLEWDIENNACENWEIVNEVKIEKPACGKCIYSEQNECKRFPPSNAHKWPIIQEDDWCGEFIRKE